MTHIDLAVRQQQIGKARCRLRHLILVVDVGFHQFCLSNIGAPSDVIAFLELCNPAVQQGIR